MRSDLKFPLSVEAIQTIIPHRFPFLFVDGVTEFVDGEYIVGRRTLSLDDPFFAGHFPGRPIMPGVLILEALAQLGAIFAKLSTDGAGPDQLIVFTGADDVRFRRVVVPGDTLELRMSVERKRRGHWRMKGTASVGGEIAAEASLMAAAVR